MLFFRLFFIVLSLAICVPATALEVKKTSVSVGGVDREIWYGESRHNPIISIKLAFKNSGTTYDPAEKLGLAYFVTAMLNEGAGEIGSEEFLQALEDNSIGFSPNADSDNFYITIKTLSENLDLSLDLLQLAITAPNFEQNDFDRIRAQLLTGLKKREESANDVANEEFGKLFFGEYEYAKVEYGDVKSLERITPEDLHKFVRKNFTKQNLVLGVAGDADEAKVQMIATKLISSLPAGNAVEEIADFAQYPQEKDVHVEKNFPQTVIIFGKKGVDRDDENFYAAYLLNHVLGGNGFQARLYKEVREKRGLTYYSWSGLQSFAHADVWKGGVATKAESRDEAIAVIREEIEKLAEQGVTHEELEAARKYVIGAYPFSLDSSRALASHILDLQLDGLPIDYAKEREKQFRAVTHEQVNAVAKKFLANDWLFVSVGAAAN